MAYESVVVHSVDLLENFRDVLQQQHDELEVVYDTLNSECTLQGENWNDPQYTYLKVCVNCIRLTSLSLNRCPDSHEM